MGSGYLLKSLSLNIVRINALESQSVFFAVRSFCINLINKCVMVSTDNSTAVDYVNKMGSAKSELCDDISKTIWGFSASINIWLKNFHIEGKDIREVEKAARDFSNDIEYMIKRRVFKGVICKSFGINDVDLFA